MTATFLPGHSFPAGQHNVLYQATDDDGNKAKCGFTITVERNDGRSRLPPPFINSGASGSECDRVPEVENGKMVCSQLINRGKKCSPVCNPDHDFYQNFNGKPPTYMCNPPKIDWTINKFIPDCSPVHKLSPGKSCEAGWEERSDRKLCIACPPGMYRGENDQLCKLCQKTHYSDKFGSPKCLRCPIHHTTKGLGSRSFKNCSPVDLEGSSLDRRTGRTEALGLMHYSRWLTPRKAWKN